jgi:hypothetical protein
MVGLCQFLAKHQNPKLVPKTLFIMEKLLVKIPTIFSNAFLDLILIALVSTTTINNAFSQGICPEDIVEDAFSFVVDGNVPGTPIVGCSAIGYKIILSNPFEPAVPVTIVFTETSLTTDPPFGPFLTPANLLENVGGFVNAGPTWTTTITLQPFEDMRTLYLTFRVDPNFPANGTQSRIDGIFTVTTPSSPSCPPVVVDCDNIFPRAAGHIIDGVKRISIEATDNDPNTPGGGMLIPALTQNFGQVIFITDGSTLISDVPDYHFPLGSKILLGKDASLIVESGKLNITNQANVVGCIEMWDRLEVQSFATLNIEGISADVNSIGVTVADSKKGILAQNNATVSVKRSTLRDNLIGIQKSFSSSLGAVNFTIDENTFKVTGFKPPFASLQSGISGVDIGNQSVAVTMNDNTFRNLLFGIRARRASLTVNQNKFFDIEDTGIATESTGSNFLRQYGSGLNDASFETCGIGISAINVEVVSQDNLMKEVNRGISLRQGVNRNVTISNNDINAKRIGIGVSNWSPVPFIGGFNVVNNTINMDENSGQGTAIFIENMQSNKTCTFKDNIINLQAAQNGVYLNNSKRCVVEENTINLLAQEELYGINAESGFENDIKCNGALGQTGTTAFTGIRMHTNASIDLSCNTVDNTQKGIHYFGDNNPTWMIGSSVNNHTYGIQYGEDQSGARTGVQPNHGNRWTQAYTGGAFGVYFKGNDNDLAFSKIEVDFADLPADPQLITNEDPTIVQNIGSIFQNKPGIALGCGGAGCPPSANAIAMSGQINPADQSVTSGTYSTSGNYQAQQAWTAKRQLYRRLIAAPGLLSQGSGYQSFYNAEANTTVGRFEQLRAGIEGLNTVPTATQSQLEANQTSMDIKLGQVASIQAQLAANPSPQLTASLIAQRTALLTDVQNLEQAQASLLDGLKSTRMATASSLLATNNAIGTTQDWEGMQRQVNAVQLENEAAGTATLTPTQVATLTPIANTCPYYGGHAVFQARALLGDQAMYNDATLCQPARPLVRKENVKAFDFQVFPNPANGFTMVALDEPAISKGQITLSNGLGETVQVQQFQKDELQVLLFVDNLSNGLYFITIVTEMGKVTKPISIVH